MAEEEVLAAELSPAAPSDHKRKLEDLEPEAPEPNKASVDHLADLNAEPVDDAPAEEAEVTAPSSEPDVKRARLDDKLDGPANGNGRQEEENEGGPMGEDAEKPSVEGFQSEDAQPPAEEVPQTVTDGNEGPSVEDSEMLNNQQPSIEDSVTETAQEPSKNEGQEPSIEVSQQEDVSQAMTRKMEVPNNKVGVLIGKSGDTIRYLQINSGAKIQIMRDADADPYAPTRPVEIIGTLDSINKAEKLISAVIAEADAGGSPSLIARGLTTAQAAAASEQIQIQVPNEKVGLIIGKGGETIKGLQTRTGARIQLIPQHLPEGDESKERTVRVTGDKKQIEMARELIKEVMNQIFLLWKAPGMSYPVRPSSFSGGFNQQAYRPRGPPQWGPRSTAYDYQHRGSYPSHNSQYPHPMYGSYPQQMAPRGGYGAGWEQRPASMQGPSPHSGGYDYYGGQGGHLSDGPVSAQLSTPIPSYASGPSPAPSGGLVPSQASYNYGQPQGPDYGHSATFSQGAHPQQSYGHGYDEPKYENHGQTQHPYGPHGSSQPVYPQAGTQPGYAAQQQYGKPQSYGMPAQGPPPQSYGTPRAAQPGEVPYQGSAAAQSYGLNAPPQQPYQYPSNTQMQQTYPPYGSAPAADGYSQPPPASGPIYPQGAQPGYGQPGAQQQVQGYGQVGPAGAYGQYASSQQGYPEQSAANNVAYGYQGPQDPSAYSGGPTTAYSAPQSGQLGYAQPAPTQASYDQSIPQSGGYGGVPASAPAAYGKTLSPQPGYPQYDSTQMYAAPR
ncbi:Far upstream element-binding protein 3 [Morella rubra]|uniref:Far upstream element-binding protein 3 n=1 Tax=Morella rubra TaxID=262757 RepID=A0A6A1VGM3_9ROSI|nr:Far upstream element-binding protein 3 [Morella rubra]